MTHEKSAFSHKQLNCIFKFAIHTWGKDAQLKMVAEECCELAKAALKFTRKTNGSTADEVIDEMADVYLMMGQLEVILNNEGHNTNQLINKRFDEKVERVISMLKHQEGNI
jgi:NTP pyrophosphatase (non-canonical NTP hydrolase)